MALVSDLDYIRHGPWDALAVGIAIQAVLAYTATGISLISAKAATILCTLAMGTTFTTQHLGFPLAASCLIILVSASLCRPRLPIIQSLITLTWVTLAVWHHDIVPPNDPTTFWWITFFLTLSVALIGLGIRYLVIRTSRMQKRLRAIEKEHERIRREERENLARELHDVVAHHITVISMQVMAQRRSHDPEELREALKIIDFSARNALAELRALLQILNTGEQKEPQPLSQQMVPSPSVIEQLDQKIDLLSSLGFRVSEMSIDPEVENLPFSLKTTCIRIIQESTTNIIKHAPPGAACSFALSVTRSHLTLRITNEHVQPTNKRLRGAASNQTMTSVHGLTSLHERVRAVGGRYHAGLEGDRWVVEATMPTERGASTP